MGARYFEHTLPALVAAIQRLAVAVERLTDARGDGPEPEPHPGPPEQENPES